MSLFMPLIEVQGNLLDPDLEESYVYFGLSHDPHCYPKGRSRVVDIGITQNTAGTRLLNGKDSQLKRLPRNLFPVQYVLAYTNATLRVAAEPYAHGQLAIDDIELTLQYVFLAITGGMPLINLVKSGGNPRLDIPYAIALLTQPFIAQLCLFADDSVSQRTAWLFKWLEQVANDASNPISLATHKHGACVRLNVQTAAQGCVQINAGQPLVSNDLIEHRSNNTVKTTPQQKQALTELDLWLK